MFIRIRHSIHQHAETRGVAGVRGVKEIAIIFIRSNGMNIQTIFNNKIILKMINQLTEIVFCYFTL